MRILGIDYGEKKIGLAISDETGLIAKRLRIVRNKRDREAIEQIVEICKANNSNRVVIGLPLGTERKETEQSKRVRQFAKWFEKALGNKVELWEESLTTQQAAQHVRKGSKGKNVDDEAARIILQEFLDWRKREGQR